MSKSMYSALQVNTFCVGFQSGALFVNLLRLLESVTAAKLIIIFVWALSVIISLLIRRALKKSLA